ncbi:MAG TPA: heme-binding domain-containing protein [Chryseolinea sp.]|nr:heme-binding domain-containing protein [Chryseolinea sp.]HPM29559.1 heme-binding domain-containing protein [Chryseolinea sp.]
MKKKIGIGVLAALIILQFVRPSRNQSEEIITENDISKKYTITESAHQVLVKKCYDCHSNNTHYPWYTNIQPIGLWMQHHVNEGKDELNFSVFNTYPERKANHKLEEISDAVNEGWMPLDSYLWVHKDAEVNQEDREAINSWIKSLGIVFEKKPKP